MLTDIFAERYSGTPIWGSFTDTESKLLVQCYRILSEQLFRPYTLDGKIDEANQEVWKELHSQLSRELGVKELSCGWYSTSKNLDGTPRIEFWPPETQCEQFLCAKYTGTSADNWVKERLSLVELAFRANADAIARENSTLDTRVQEMEKRFPKGLRSVALPGGVGEGMRKYNEQINEAFNAAVKELNVRLQRAGTRLNYHNGFFQIVSDQLIAAIVEKSFWALLDQPKWKNVDIDVKEALDRRDSNGRDPAFYAAKALESVIKIVSDDKGWTHGKETGAHAYIDNLTMKKNGAFIEAWEATSLKGFFSSVRNSQGHGPGSAPMPMLSPQQTDWAIEFCMCWTKSLIQRL